MGEKKLDGRARFQPLSDRLIQATVGQSKVQRIFDRRGDGLYLHVSAVADDADEERRRNPARSWMVRYRHAGKRVEKGLGPYPRVSLQDARRRAEDVQRQLQGGADPFAQQQAAKEARRVAEEKRKAAAAAKRSAITFEEATRRVYRRELPNWKNPKHGPIWIGSMEKHVFPTIGRLEVKEIGRPDLLRVLEALWADKPDTARRVRQRMALVFDWAIGAGHHPGPNPVDDALKRALPKMKRVTENRPALPWEALPEFWKDLTKHDTISSVALQFLILTASRYGEVRGARWEEFDLQAGVWTIPADRMKMDREHRVPLAPAALDILRRVEGLHGEIVFPTPCPRKGKEPYLSENALTSFLHKTLKRDDFVPHGFRTTFRTWTQESARAGWEVAEAALAHRIGDDVQSRYARSSYFDLRRPLMAQWAAFATGHGGEEPAAAEAA